MVEGLEIQSLACLAFPHLLVAAPEAPLRALEFCGDSLKNYHPISQGREIRAREVM